MRLASKIAQTDFPDDIKAEDNPTPSQKSKDKEIDDYFIIGTKLSSERT